MKTKYLFNREKLQKRLDYLKTNPPIPIKGEFIWTDDKRVGFKENKDGKFEIFQPE